MTEFHSHGKLLLTAEYVVLDGATAIALPTVPGQTMIITPGSKGRTIIWEAYLPENQFWFSAEIDSNTLRLLNTTDNAAGENLRKILKVVSELNPVEIKDKSFIIRTFLEFPAKWGLGSSSTLIALLSQAFNVNAYQLLNETFGGSGYDVSCALMPKPQTFRLGKKERKIQFVELNAAITPYLFFVYLNKKKNSREGIQLYKSIPKSERLIKSISDISYEIVKSDNLNDFEDLIYVHEHLISEHLGISPVKQELFPEYAGGEVKSLGAWGGDFVLVTSQEKDLTYFKNKGYVTVFSYDELILI